MAFTDVEMAILSQAAYKVTRRFENESLYSVLTDPKMNKYLKSSLGSEYEKQLNALINKAKDADYTIVKTQDNTINGFAAFAVKEPNNNVTVACRGTEIGEKGVQSALDVWEDIKLGLSKETAQQKDMETFMSELQSKGDYEGYSFTGHSLGGNLAMYGAITLDDKSKLIKCKTFNAPGFNSKFYSNHKSEIEEAEKGDRMISYQNKYDGVSEALTVPGKKVILSSKKKDRDGKTGHGLNDLVIKGNGFKTSKKKSVTNLGVVLYTLSRIPDSFLILGPVNPSMMSFAASDVKMSSSVSGIGYSGSKKIELTPTELKGQASQMLALSNEYEQLFNNVVSDLNSVNGNWSPNLANNFAGKITSAQEKFKIVPDMLTTGSAVATMAANNFEGTDSLLAKVISVDTIKQDDGSVVGTIRGSVGHI